MVYTLRCGFNGPCLDEGGSTLLKKKKISNWSFLVFSFKKMYTTDTHKNKKKSLLKSWDGSFSFHGFNFQPNFGTNSILKIVPTTNLRRDKVICVVVTSLTKRNY